MPVQPPVSYPGVYVQEVPSGVRTIAGVSTSVTAFAGTTKRGPVNKAVLITSFSDFERRFGGLSADSELSYSVRQFFLNGGSQAIIIRLAKDPQAASRILYNSATEILANQVMQIEALDQGKETNNIELRIDYLTGNPDSTFNLFLNYASKDNPSDSRSEPFLNLSMNSRHPRYFVNQINDISSLVKVSRTASNALMTGLGAGVARSGDLTTDVTDPTVLDDAHKSFRVAVNHLDPVAVQIDLPGDVGGADADAHLTSLCAAIEAKVRAQAGGENALLNFTCARDGSQIVMTSGVAGENSRVIVLPGASNDASNRLKLGTGNGGREIDAAASLRPTQMPARSTLTGGELLEADLTGPPLLPSANNNKLKISLDGAVPGQIEIPTGPLGGADHAANMGVLAARIQAAVRALRPGSTSFQNFECTVDTSGANPRLVLSPGSRGSNSSVQVFEVAGDGLAAGLELLAGIAGASRTQPLNATLQNGAESPFDPAEAYPIFIGSLAQRTGIYALEDMDIFNILCLPAIDHSGILMDAEAYCRSRRAFLLVDAPFSKNNPDDMRTFIAGSEFPKSDYAAVFYPWIKISDPLNNGQMRPAPPSGAMAGLFARIDSNRGVWKAPAGTEANLVGARALNYLLTDGENGLLNPLGVNCLRAFPASGIVSWGSRTLAGSDERAHEYKYLSVRRTALFIEESLYRGLKWAVFEPNDEPLWAQIRLNAGAFMHNLFRQGAFQGQVKKDAYFVKCDAETTTQNDINLGIVNVWIGFAPLKPAEFVILYLQQMAGQIQV